MSPVPRRAHPVRSAAAALAAGGTTALVGRALRPGGPLRPAPDGLLERVNFHGRTVSLRGGAALAVGALTGALAAGSAPAAVATGCAGAAGAVDDLDAGAHDGDAPAKGLRGHLTALAHGRVTTGVLKIGAIGAGAVVAGGTLAAERAGRRTTPGAARPRAAPATLADAAVSAVAIASWANVHNLLDLRPGRALKASVLLAGPLALAPGEDAATTRRLAVAALGAAATAAPDDLAERTMLGDTGANALGALVGTAIAAHPSRALRAVVAATGTGLVLASERVSFSRVIAATPALAALDALGRREA